MKKLIVLALFAFAVSNTATAQIELKINPLGLLYSSPDIVAEYLVNEDIGVELGIGLVYGSYGNDIFQQGILYNSSASQIFESTASAKFPRFMPFFK